LNWSHKCRNVIVTLDYVNSCPQILIGPQLLINHFFMRLDNHDHDGGLIIGIAMYFCKTVIEHIPKNHLEKYPYHPPLSDFLQGV